MDPEEPREEVRSRISRRSALKRIGAGAAVAWSAPILTSLRTPAYGQEYLCPGPPGRGCALNGDDCGGQVACQAGTCSCLRTTEGTCFCHAFSSCAALKTCVSSADCVGLGPFACAHSCCGVTLCVPSCTHGGLGQGGPTTNGG